MTKAQAGFSAGTYSIIAKNSFCKHILSYMYPSRATDIMDFGVVHFGSDTPAKDQKADSKKETKKLQKYSKGPKVEKMFGG